MTQCEVCLKRNGYPVLVDESYETWLCRKCIKEVRNEVTVEEMND